MIDKSSASEMLAFYEKHLKYDILPFWLSNSIDEVDGGFYNCFENNGNKLISYDKYTWSQGRFVWIWAKLSMMKSNTFGKDEKEYFLKLAESGRNFLYDNCFLNAGKDRCVFCMDKKGNHKLLEGCTKYDVGSGADKFALLGFSQYSVACHDIESYKVAKRLYNTLKKSMHGGNYGDIPYPLPSGYRSHLYEMTFTNIAYEMFQAAKIFEPDDCEGYINDSLKCIDATINEFTDDNAVLHEYMTHDRDFDDTLLSRIQKPGHVIEDMWFILNVIEEIGNKEFLPYVEAITRKAFENGWDKVSGGGILLFCDQEGGEPRGTTNGIENEEMTKHIISNWSKKVWWVHSEALYTSLLLYHITGDEYFWKMHKKTFDLTFRVFPDVVFGEWTQILDRNFRPDNKPVALPVKDPFHIIRNLIYMIELLYFVVFNQK